MKRYRLEPRFVWLLGTMLRKAGIDISYIDSSLNYWENKNNIEHQFDVKLSLS